MPDEKVHTTDDATKLESQVGDADVVLVGAGVKSSTGGIIVAPYTDGTTAVKVVKADESTVVASFDTTNKRMYVGGNSAPAAIVDLASGGGAGGVPPIRLPSANLTAAAVAGAMEYDGTDFWLSNTTIRYKTNNQLGNLSQFPRGTVDRTASQLSWNNTNKSVSLAVKSPATSYDIIEYAATGSVKRNFTTTQTATIGTPAAGLWWIYFLNGVLTAGTSLPNGFETCMIAAVFLDASNNGINLMDERHGPTMDWRTHQYLHTTIGTRYASGFTYSRIAAGTGAADGDAQVWYTGGQIWDEDISIDIVRTASPANDFEQELGIAATPGKIPVYYRSSTGANNWVKDVATNYPCKFVATRLSYNLNTAGTWTVPAAGANNDYVVYFIVATDSITEPVIAIMGQLDTGTLATATAYQFSDLALGNLPFNEMKPLTKLIYRTSTAYANAVKGYVNSSADLRNVSPLPSGTFIATDHASLTGLSNPNQHPATAVSTDTTNFNGNLSTADTDVQKALDTIDNLVIPTPLTGITNSASPWTTALGSGAGGAVPSGTNNSFLGYRAGLLVSTGNRNICVGNNAGDALTTTSDNVLIGYNAGTALGAAGSPNTAIGASALAAMTTGQQQTAVGYQALLSNDNSGNTAVGYQAIAASTSGINNVAVGALAATSLNDSYNVAVGYGAGRVTSGTAGGSSTSVGYNARSAHTGATGVAIGCQAMQTGSGVSNIAIGFNALNNCGVGTQDVVVGTSSGSTNTGSYNVFVGNTIGDAGAGAAANNVGIGYQAFNVLTSGTNNVAVGYRAGAAISTNGNSTYIGYQAGQAATGVGNICLGYNTALNAAADTNEIVIGVSATGKGSNTGLVFTNSLYFGDGTAGVKTLYANDNNANRGIRYNGGGTNIWELCNDGTNWVAISSNLTGYTNGATDFNTAVGVGAGTTPSGQRHTSLGYFAAHAVMSSYDNTCLGYYAGAALTGQQSNTFVGSGAGRYSTDSNSVAVGASAGQRMTGSYNTAVGSSALGSGTGGSGGNNVCIGNSAGLGVTSGSSNTAVGYQAGDTITTGYYNTCIGVDADTAAGAYSCVCIGELAVSSGASDCHQIGTGTNGNGISTLQVGGSGAPSIACYASSWNPYSDERIKKDIVSLGPECGLTFVESLRPVSFKLKDVKSEQQQRTRFGLIAQEVKRTMEAQGLTPHGVYTDVDEGTWGLDYDQLVAPLIKSVQELSAMVKDLRAEVALLKAR